MIWFFSAPIPLTKVDHYFNELSRRDRADGVIIISLHPDETYVARFRKSSYACSVVGCSAPRYKQYRC